VIVSNYEYDKGVKKGFSAANAVAREQQRALIQPIATPSDFAKISGLFCKPKNTGREVTG
jgi:hypothetical protein